MRMRIMLSLTAFTTLSILTAVYAAAEEKEMKMGKHWHHRCPCIMACDPNCREMCKQMGMSECMMERCRMMMHTRMDVNAPESLLAMKDKLMLTEEQVGKLKSIAEKGQKDSEMLLTAQQKEMLQKMAGTPDTMIMMHKEMMPMMKKTEMKEEAIEEKDKETTTMTGLSTKEEATEQKFCPITGKPIDKEKRYWTMYKGKRVYFCCSMCKAEFEKDPEKYIKNLPQFKQ
jgi:YHS domain-containing protein